MDLKGVTNLEADMDTQTATMTIDEDVIKAEDIIKLLDKEGFPSEEIVPKKDPGPGP